MGHGRARLEVVAAAAGQGVHARRQGAAVALAVLGHPRAEAEVEAAQAGPDHPREAAVVGPAVHAHQAWVAAAEGHLAPRVVPVALAQRLRQRQRAAAFWRVASAAAARRLS